NPTDAELAKRIRNSESHAFKILYYRYFEALYGFIWQQTRNYELSEDLTQEVFYRIWAGRKKVNPQRAIKSYLYRTAKNLVIDHRRKQSLEREYWTRTQSGQAQNLEADEIDIRDEILSTIDDLPEPLRIVFTLSRFEGLKYKEIAETLNVSIKTVQSRMSKALKILQEKLHHLLTNTIFLHFF
ncbi:RNA polymerase sigma-70 factor, partial [candidate division KSB1 bacterium]|nr:RNA polymerase sigma-70 factor [candidate division KSB1 bacterium]